MKTKNLLIIAFMIIGAISISSCAKKTGCTDANATNFDSDAKKDDGSCTYKGQLIFWWKKPFSDTANAHGATTAQVTVDGAFQGTLNFGTQFWNSSPSCGASATITVDKDFGSAKTKSVSIKYDLTFDNIPISHTESKPLNVGCNSYELTN